MSYLTDIKFRHGRDRVHDAGFIGTALLVTALALAIMTSKVVGKPIVHTWAVTVVDPAMLPEAR